MEGEDPGGRAERGAARQHPLQAVDVAAEPENRRVPRCRAAAAQRAGGAGGVGVGLPRGAAREVEREVPGERGVLRGDSAMSMEMLLVHDGITDVWADEG